MTNAEAIEHLKNIKIYSFQDGYTDEAREALNMAIKALEESRWIPCKDRLPDEDHGLGGSGKQFSDMVLISINREDEDAWSYISQTIDGEWALELPRHCEIAAWRPLPEPYREEDTDVNVKS